MKIFSYKNWIPFISVVGVLSLPFKRFIMEVPKNKSNKLIKVLKISGITLGSVAALLYITPHFFKDTITKSVNEIAKDYVKSKVSFESVNLSFYKHFPNLTVTLDNSKIGASEHFPNQNFILSKRIK